MYAEGVWFYRVFNETGLLVRFAIGDVPQGYETQIEDEEARFGKFLRIPGKVWTKLVLPKMLLHALSQTSSPWF